MQYIVQYIPIDNTQQLTSIYKKKKFTLIKNFVTVNFVLTADVTDAVLSLTILQ